MIKKQPHHQGNCIKHIAKNNGNGQPKENGKQAVERMLVEREHAQNNTRSVNSVLR